MRLRRSSGEYGDVECCVESGDDEVYLGVYLWRVFGKIE